MQRFEVENVYVRVCAQHILYEILNEKDKLFVWLRAAYIPRERFIEKVYHIARPPARPMYSLKTNAECIAITRLSPFKNKTVTWRCNLCAFVWSLYGEYR